VTHLNLNDRTVEGMRHRLFPVFSVQYHPEAAPGPNDAEYFFGQFPIDRILKLGFPFLLPRIMIQLIITLPHGFPRADASFRVAGISHHDWKRRGALWSSRMNPWLRHMWSCCWTRGYLVADLVGGGATKINGHPVEPGTHYQLETGTVIQMGEVEAVYINADTSEDVAELDTAEASSVEHASLAQGDNDEDSGVSAGSGRGGSGGRASGCSGAGISARGYPLPKHPLEFCAPRKAAAVCGSWGPSRSRLWLWRPPLRLAT
jgi:hypothetical protein